MRKLLAIFLAILTIALAGCINQGEKKEEVTLNVGYLPTDHQAALFVAALNPDLFKEKYGLYLKEVEPKKKYELYKGDKKIADINLYLVTTGGADIMNLMYQGRLDLGLLGVPPAIFYIDKNPQANIIMSLHTDGSAVVVRKDIPVNNWEEFVNWIKEQAKEGKQVRIGHPLPTSIQYVMIKDALKVSGISYTETSGEKADVLLVNCKGQKSMPQMLANNKLDAVIAWEPMPEILKHEGIGKPIVYSQDLPSSTGGTWKSHPCCCVVASKKALSEKEEVVVEFCKLLKYATDEINKNKELAAEASAKWLGVKKEIEDDSVKHITYTYKLTDIVPGTLKFVKAMQLQGLMKNSLKYVNEEKAKEIIFNFKVYDEIVK
ncbi:ABC-type nitrate/sulfonate/bicarbonate transport system, periplasmic component [Methanocaldococcus infernus ME]|uniref:ABC-type nitrate/sulfonate/bicarbonate transport system, periplasmic component n=1 Tax=Methanocaldococcus infernus (strain DSM 11812 / JCM 15783 / ME) TaxID=573063 RepID=D5VQA4_METIM|nr:ABC transporter substrate-binding protein [Methanocaldococcus infernus]ADG12757.1 ABC-type nitrate/sulfonate/bicarbonate transport system, periplasmic component [Methanocaldococcus infernus ME]